ncbi:hypothetical protein K443DRAFT_117673 [Laccaria amethystina LaAM-08-1]|uniref:Uncharacterized protein n=1 Tax=Laccaria amethystina LaAM-08-1 TaxID=1095629 RepID=A0A0C9WPW1_9AGAR|nr:hypothetical protein K443DRAFT_117673 [Laccaria amethystina LaAM-08-1]
MPDRHHEAILYLGPGGTRGIHHRILKISVVLCFRRMVYSIFMMSLEGPKETRGSRVLPHLFLSSKALLQCIPVSFEAPEETRDSRVRVLELLYIFCFGEQIP